MKTIGFALLLALCSSASMAQVDSNPHSSLVTPATDAVLQDLRLAHRPVTVLRRGDVIAVRVFGVADFTGDQRIADDGSVNLPLIGDVVIAGLTLSQASNLVSNQLKTSGMVRDAQVTLTAVSSPSNVVTVFGAVVKPGTFPGFGDLTILDYIADAGGFQEAGLGTAVNTSAADYVVTLTRPGLKTPVTIPLGKSPDRSRYGSIPLFPGDTILVGKVGLIYAVGAFHSQGEFPLKNSSATSVTQLIALAGGVGYEADRKDAHIVREVNNARVAIPVDIKGILKGTKPDIELQADDILFVPSNDLRAAIKGGGSGLIVSLASSFLLSR